MQSWLCVGHCTAAGSSLARLVEGENVCLSVERKVSCFCVFSPPRRNGIQRELNGNGNAVNT